MDKKTSLWKRLLWWIDRNIVYGDARVQYLFLIVCICVSVVLTAINIWIMRHK